MPKVITNYTKFTDQEISIIAQRAYNCLNPNSNFTWDETVMPNFQSTITNYNNAYQKSRGGTTQDILEKNDAREALNNSLKLISMEVNLQGNNNLTILQSSGLILSKDRSKIGTLPKPTGFEVKTGDNTGDLCCTVDSIKETKIYLFYSAQVPASANNNEWRVTTSSTRKKNISGFIPGKQYEIKSAYQGSEPTLVFSDSIFIFAQ